MTDSKPDLLYICHRVPFPPNKGDKIRTFNEIKFLSKNWNIDLVSFADTPEDLKYGSDLEKLCRNVFLFPLNPFWAKIKGVQSFLTGKSITEGYFFDITANRRVSALLKEKTYHAIFCFSSPMAAYIFKNLPTIRKKRPVPRLVMDFCDVDSEKWRQYSETAGFPMAMIYKTEFKRLLAYEKKINQEFDTSVFVSKNESLLFKSLIPSAKNVVSVSNGVDFDYFSGLQRKSQTGNAPTLMFAGAMDYYANIEGVTWFCSHILPKIKEIFPDICFMIVGSNPSSEVRALSKIDNVQVTGYVEDIREYYEKADVCVIPLRIARGIQNKVLEAMAMEKPVVCTSAAFSGINTEPGKHLLIEDREDAFADAIMTLLRNREYAQTLGRAARTMMKSEYAWDTCLEKIGEILR